jgi:flagella basal body P-ring formation protein FlgA
MPHRPPKSRRLLLVLWLGAAPAIGSNFQDVAQLESLARTEAARQLPPLSDKQRMLVGPIPPGLRYSRCETGVSAAVAPGLQVRGRVLIELHCADAKPWQLYVPVRIVATSTVAVAAHAIVVGTVLTAKDLAVDRRDATELPPGYLDDPSIAVGLTAARPISEGAILTNQQLLGSKAVQRGQTVTLIADAGGISVRMAGRALSDGLINQRIKVENLSSGRVVEGIARSEQVVEIVFQ